MNMIESIQWADAIYQISRADRVEGGSGGIANIQAGQLASRTNFLRAMIEGASDYKEFTFYKTDADPDGTISGISNTPDNKLFRVAQGLGSLYSFIYYLKSSGNAIPVARVPAADQVDEMAITSGDLFSTLAFRGAALNGGHVINDALNRVVGVTVPAGSAGSSSYFCPDIPAAALRNRAVRITQIYSASDNWLNTVNLNMLRAQSRAGSAVSTLAVSDYAISQTGNIVTQTGTVIVPPGADYVGLAIQYASNAAVTAKDMSFRLTQTAYIMLPDAGSVVTENDGMLNIRLAPVAANAADAKAIAESALLTSGNVHTTGTSQVFDGAEKINSPSGEATGLRIPAGAGTGQGSYITSWLSAAGLSGYTLKIKAVFTTSAGWSKDPAPNTLALQVRRGSGQVNITAGSGATRTITQNGNIMTIDIQYTVEPDDIDIGVVYQIAGGNAVRDYERSMEIEAISYTVIPAAGDTPNKAMLSIFIDEAIRQMSAGARIITVTVKPDGGDYTHPKLALDHITDASAIKKYVVAIYPGIYDGYAEWHTKEHVDLVGMGRREEVIIGYDCGADADRETVRNTSLMWMASESMLKNLTLKIKNGRYCIHLESNGTRPGITTKIEDCAVIHEGNAVDNYWWQPSQYAVGAGLSAGQTVMMRNSYFKGPGGGFSFHTPNNRVEYTAPIFVDAEACIFENSRTNTNTEYPYAGSFWIKPITKGAADTCRLVGCTFINGGVYYSTGEWLDTADTTTNRAQVKVWGHSNKGFSFYSNEPYIPDMTGVNE